MPTIEAQCSPDWRPRKGISNPRFDTVRFMAQRIRVITAQVVTEHDDTSGTDDEITLDQVWVNWGDIDEEAINAAEVLFVVRPPEIKDSYDNQEARRDALAAEIKQRLVDELIAGSDGLIIPDKWEVEVIPERSSGYGLNARCEVKYDW